MMDYQQQSMLESNAGNLSFDSMFGPKSVATVRYQQRANDDDCKTDTSEQSRPRYCRRLVFFQQRSRMYSEQTHADGRVKSSLF